MPKIITEKLKQNIEAYKVSPNVAKGISDGSISLILSSKLNNKDAGKLFYLVGDGGNLDSKAYGIIKVMSGEKVRKNDLSKLSNLHKYTDEQIEKKWPNKHVLYSYKFNLLDVFPKPINVRLEPKTNVIKNMDVQIGDSQIELNDDLFKDITLSDNFISYAGNEIYIDNSIDLKEEIKSKLPFGEYVNFNEGTSDNYVYRLKLEKINKDSENLIDETVQENLQTYYYDEDIKDQLEDSVKYVIEEVMSDDVAIIQKNGENIKVLNESETSFKLSEDTKEQLKMLYGGNYVIKAYNSDKLHVFDCLYFNNENITNKKWFDRKGSLNYMNFNNDIQKLDSTVVDNINSVMIATKLRSLNNSDVIIKRWDSSYESSSLVKKFTLESKREHEVYTSDSINETLSCTNERFFKSWNSTMAYYLGFIVTDGHVDYKNGLVEIMIGKEDKEILNGLAKALGGVSVKPINNSVRLRWRSKVMLEDLKSLGATGLKETRTTYQKVPSNYTWDFLRGMFDADGNNYKGRLQMDNSCGGSLKWAVKHFKTIAGKDAHLYQYTKHWKSPHYKIVVLGEGAKKLHKKLYSGSLGLIRKAKFQ